MPPSNGYNVSGIPDFIGCYKGKFFAIEAKSNMTKHPVTALQQRQIDLITSHQGVALVIDETGLDTLAEIIRGI